MLDTERGGPGFYCYFAFSGGVVIDDSISECVRILLPLRMGIGRKEGRGGRAPGFRSPPRPVKSHRLPPAVRAGRETEREGLLRSELLLLLSTYLFFIYLFFPFDFLFYFWFLIFFARAREDTYNTHTFTAFFFLFFLFFFWGTCKNVQIHSITYLLSYFTLHYAQSCFIIIKRLK